MSAVLQMPLSEEKRFPTFHLAHKENTCRISTSLTILEMRISEVSQGYPELYVL